MIQPSSNGQPHFEKTLVNNFSRLSKGSLRRVMHNLNAKVTYNYNIVEDLAQALVVMSALEVLQIFPTQSKKILSSIDGVDPSCSNIMSFNPCFWKPYLPHHLAFHVMVHVFRQRVHRKILDEGVLTCIMSSKCWKSLGSPTLSAPISTLKAFDQNTLQPHRVFFALPIELGRKMIFVEVKVIDGPLYYKLFFGRSFFYTMTIVVSTMFHVVMFPHDGKIAIID